VVLVNSRVHWRVYAYLLSCAAIIFVAGMLLGHWIARRQLEALRDVESWRERVGSKFNQTVHPEPEQTARIKAHMDRAVQDLQAISFDAVVRSTNVIWRLVGEVDKELTPEQRRAFEAMKPKPGEITLDMVKFKGTKDR
jgi:hypothetical protein